ncbi:MAG: 4-hydroxythreonine-4-phosphate dehydrogenase PdxA [Chitinispirillaceae bacterium]|nr:4-hydroxythreonine-4-phosphate dehydrogenase PdxA [Chitinispirillaceae bacterium]
MKKPLFALTMGDPAGIGPELCIKIYQQITTSDIIIVGDFTVLQKTALEMERAPAFNSISSVKGYKPGCLNILDMGIIKPEQFTTGTVNRLCGTAAYTYINKAIDLALTNEVDGVVTNPINKESLQLAGVKFPGHTEIFADRTGVCDFAMMFLLENVCVAHVTTHCSLKQAIDLISAERVLNKIILLNKTLIMLGIQKPRIAVGGLNPHAGEHGLFGTEEIDHITPAINEARHLGIDATGPYPPDTVFMRAFKGDYDGVVAMLHDHGFVALKSKDFENGVNITIGLPIIRTSVGHGTAFDIAGKGMASADSLKRAVETAERLYQHKI